MTLCVILIIFQIYGSSDGYTKDLPAPQVTVDAFYLETHEVTNDAFERFVDATGYVTEVQFRAQVFFSLHEILTTLHSLPSQQLNSV